MHKAKREELQGERTSTMLLENCNTRLSEIDNQAVKYPDGTATKLGSKQTYKAHATNNSVSYFFTNTQGTFRKSISL